MKQAKANVVAQFMRETAGEMNAVADLLEAGQMDAAKTRLLGALAKVKTLPERLKGVKDAESMEA